MIDQYEDDPKTAIAYFYFDFNDKKKQKPENLLSSLLAQLAQRASKSNKDVPRALKDLYTSSKDAADEKKPSPTYDGMYSTLVSLVSEFDQVYICLDALDECTDRKRLLGIVKRILKEPLTRLNILATSRKERDLEASLTKIASKCIDLQNAGVDADIQRYIEDELSNDWKFTEPPTEVKEDIKKALMGKAKGM
jgi:hypothetical protein